jgi:hypothetical protein
LVLAQVAAGGDSPQGDLRVQDGHVQEATVGPAVDSVQAGDSLAGTLNWFFVIDDFDLSVTNPTITVDSGYPASAFTGLGASSFPVTVTQASLDAGQSFFSNPLAQFGVTTIPTTMTAGFDSSRSVTPAVVPVGGGDQQVTVSVTPQTTGPDYKVSVGDLPGVTVTADSGPSNLDQGETLDELPGEFDLNNAVAGKTYTFTFTDSVPNPYGVPWTHKPFVFVNGGVENISCCSGPSNSVDFADSTLDGGTPGRGHVTYSVDQTVNNWAIDNGNFSEVQYGALDVPPTLPAPTLGASPTTVVRPAPFSINGTGIPGGTVSLFDGANQVQSGIPVNGTGNWSTSLSPIVGSHTLTAIETISDATSAASAPVTVNVVPATPGITQATAVSSGNEVGSGGALNASAAPASFTLTGNGFFGAGQTPPTGSTVTVFEGSTPLGSAVVGSNSSWSLTASLGFGLHTLTATQTLAGETSGLSTPFVLNVLATPTSFKVGLSSNTVVSDAGVTVKVTALDSNGHTLTAFAGPVKLSDLSGTLQAGGVSWANGVGTASVTFSAAFNPDRVTATDPNDAVTGSSGTFDLIGPLDHFFVGSPGTPISAGSTATVRITAQDSLNQTVTDYSGTVTLSDLSHTLSLVGPISWSGGVGTATVTFAGAFNPDRVTATDTLDAVTSSSGTFDLIGPLDHFLVGTPGSSIIAGATGTVRITAQDSLNQTVKAYSGTIALSDLSGSLTVIGPITWSGGVATVSVSFSAAFNPDRVTATDSVSGATGTSGTFQVKPPSSGTPGTPLPGGL